ncbi:MAG TPA: CsbD family protein [Acidobacteriaceae bacterium]|jgi:uncharacterized protein YjbJ (UPF0337 family)|nr:CsbD family protein [Acidobacteriaceae bacterium]
MNKSHVTGGIDQAVGKIKEAAGNATGDQKLANEGAAQQIKGAAKETWGNVKDSANKASATAWSRMSSSEARAGEKSREFREKVTTAVQNAKHTIAGKLDDFNKKQEDKRDDGVRKAS